MKRIFAIPTSVFISQLISSRENDSTKKIGQPVTITGSADAYCRHDFNNPQV